MNRVRASIVAAALIAIAPAAAAGQSLPRTSDGKPELSGIWQAVNTAAWNILPHRAEAGVPGGLGVVDGNEIPYTPAAAAKQRDNYTNRICPAFRAPPTWACRSRSCRRLPRSLSCTNTTTRCETSS